MGQRHKYYPCEARDIRLISEGRGQGEKADYICWFQCHEENYPGTSFRIYNPKIGRMHQVFGRSQIYLLLQLMYAKEIVDIRENFPLLPAARFYASHSKNHSKGLPTAETLSIAKEYSKDHSSFKHPKYSRSKDLKVLTTDFLITKTDGTKCAISIRTENSFKDISRFRKHIIEELYWQSRLIPFTVVEKDKINRQFSNNIRDIILPSPLSERVFSGSPNISLAVESFQKMFSNTTDSVVEIARRIEKDYQFPEGTGINIFQYLMQNRKIRYNMKSKSINKCENRNDSPSPLYNPPVNPLQESAGAIPLTGQVWSVNKPSDSMGDSLAKTLPESFRILKIDWKTDLTYYIGLADTCHRPKAASFRCFCQLAEEKAIIPNPGAYSYKAPHASQIDEAMRKRAKFWYDLFIQYDLMGKGITDPKYYRTIISSIMTSHSLSRNAVVAITERYLKSGCDYESLYPRFTDRGRRKGNTSTNSLSTEEQKRLDIFLWKNCAVRNPPTLISLYDDYCIMYFSDPDSRIDHSKADNLKSGLLPEESRISFSQFYYHFQDWTERNYSSVLQATDGRINYLLKDRDALEKNDYSPCGPGSRFFIDSTRCDYCVVDRFHKRAKIGRPMLTLVTDVMSRMIVGYHLSLFGGESNLTFRLALFNAFTDKVSHCKRFGIEITSEQWPCQYLPASLVTDNGSPYKSFLSDSVCETLHIAIESLEPCRGDLKGELEHMFYSVNNHFGRMPGRVTKDRDIDYRKEACVTMPELHQLVIQFILNYNLSTAVNLKATPDLAGVEILPTPINLWNWGIRNRSGLLRSLSPERIYSALLPVASARITRKGLLVKKHYYTNSVARDQYEWFIKAGNNYPVTKQSDNPFEVPVRYDPIYEGAVFYDDPISGKILTFELFGDEADVYADLTEEEAAYEVSRKESLLNRQKELQREAKQASKRYQSQILAKAKKNNKEEYSIESDYALKSEISRQVSEDLSEIYQRILQGETSRDSKTEPIQH